MKGKEVRVWLEVVKLKQTQLVGNFVEGERARGRRPIKTIRQ